MNLMPSPTTVSIITALVLVTATVVLLFKPLP